MSSVKTRSAQHARCPRRKSSALVQASLRHSRSGIPPNFVS